MEGAIFEAGGISAANHEWLQKVGWQRCARTDKGVHALGQILSLKLELFCESFEEMRERINQRLPLAVRVQAVRRVLNNFNARTACEARTYEYLLPTAALQPSARSVLAHASDPVPSPASPSAPSACSSPAAAAASAPPAPEATQRPSGGSGLSEQLEAFRNLLRVYEGTHNFHNVRFAPLSLSLFLSRLRYIRDIHRYRSLCRKLSLLMRRAVHGGVFAIGRVGEAAHASGGGVGAAPGARAGGGAGGD